MCTNRRKMGRIFVVRVEVIAMGDQVREISNALAEMKTLTDEQLYTDLSSQFITELRDHVYDAAERSLSKEDRDEMKNWHGAGLYGPISAVFGRLEDRYQFDLMRVRQARPNVEQGRNIFSGNWEWVKNKICKEWNYCKKKKEFSDENKLLIAIIALVLAGTSWHVRTATAVILLAWHQGPKFMCACPDEESANITSQSSGSSTSASPRRQSRRQTRQGRKGRAPRRQD